MKKVLLQISEIGLIKEYEKDDCIETTDKNIYIIQHGKVCKSHYSKDGGEKILYFLSAGGMFGEKEYFEGSKPNIIIKTIRKTKISVLNEEIVESILREYPVVFKYIISNIIRKTRIIEAQLISAVFGDSNGRVADVLLRLFYQDGSNYDKRKRIRKKHTHEEIAKIIGCSRVTVTKSLNEFERNNIIEMKFNDIIIKDPDGLSEYVKWR